MVYVDYTKAFRPKWYISTIPRVSDQNGISGLYIIVKIYHSGRKLSMYYIIVEIYQSGRKPSHVLTVLVHVFHGTLVLVLVGLSLGSHDDGNCHTNPDCVNDQFWLGTKWSCLLWLSSPPLSSSMALTGCPGIFTAVESPGTGTFTAVESPGTGVFTAVESPRTGTFTAVESPRTGTFTAVESHTTGVFQQYNHLGLGFS